MWEESKGDIRNMTKSTVVYQDDAVEITSIDDLLTHCEPFIQHDARGYANDTIPELDFDDLCQEGRAFLAKCWEGKKDLYDTDRLIKHWRYGFQNRLKDIRRSAYAACRHPGRTRQLELSTNEQQPWATDNTQRTWASIADKGVDAAVDVVILREQIDTIRAKLPPLGKAVLELLLSPPTARDSEANGPRESAQAQLDELAERLEISPAKARPVINRVKAALLEVLQSR